jgi:hypothetical protein
LDHDSPQQPNAPFPDTNHIAALLILHFVSSFSEPELVFCLRQLSPKFRDQKDQLGVSLGISLSIREGSARDQLINTAILKAIFLVSSANQQPMRTKKKGEMISKKVG